MLSTCTDLCLDLQNYQMHTGGDGGGGGGRRDSESKEPLHSNKHILNSCYMPVGAGSIYGKWVSPSGRGVAKRGPPLDGLMRETHLFG